jgi:hypothetical protein
MVQAIGTPTAQMARRLRLIRFLLGTSLAILIGLLGLLLAVTGTLGSRPGETAFMIVAAVTWISFLVWNAATFRVSCPRCGWNVLFNRRLLMNAFTPSACPNCGLDLERTYDRIS